MNCKKCGRPVAKIATGLNARLCEGGNVCDFLAAAYRRGVLRGVEIAKEHAGILFRSEPDDICINWTRVDREAAKLAGDG